MAKKWNRKVTNEVNKGRSLRDKLKRRANGKNQWIERHLFLPLEAQIYYCLENTTVAKHLKSASKATFLQKTCFCFKWLWNSIPFWSLAFCLPHSVFGHLTNCLLK